MKTIYGGLLALGILLCALMPVWLWIPIYNGLIVSCISTPQAPYWLIFGLFLVGFIISGLIYAICGDSKKASILEMTMFVLMLVTLAIAIVSSFNVVPQFANQVNVQEISSIPAMDLDNMRMMPMGNAYRYAADSLQSPRHTLHSNYANLLYIDGRPTWQFIIAPSGFWNAWAVNSIGISEVDMTTTQKNIKVTERDLAVGPGQLWYDAIEWHTLSRIGDYSATYCYDCMYVVNVDGELFYVIPMIKYEWQGGILMPVFGGVAVVGEDGETFKLNPKQAVDSVYTKDNPIIPEKLARIYVDVINYRKGVPNVWFYHEDQFRIADPETEYNKQPWLVKDAEDGLWWLFAVEPYSSHGIYEIYLVGARDPTVTVYVKQFSIESALLGPNQAMDYVKKAYPMFDWVSDTKEGTIGSFMTVEPLPIFLNDRLYWRIPVVPKDHAGIAIITLVDAETGDVTELKDLHKTISTPTEKTSLDLLMDKIAELEKDLADLKEAAKQLQSET